MVEGCPVLVLFVVIHPPPAVSRSTASGGEFAQVAPGKTCIAGEEEEVAGVALVDLASEIGVLAVEGVGGAGGAALAEVDVVDGGKLEAQGEGYLEGTCTVEGVAFRVVVDVEEG